MGLPVVPENACTIMTSMDPQLERTYMPKGPYEVDTWVVTHPSPITIVTGCRPKIDACHLSRPQAQATASHLHDFKCSRNLLSKS